MLGSGLGTAVLFIVIIYMILEYQIDGRKIKAWRTMLPDYLQIASANLRSGIALDRAMLMAARPEFSFLSEDIKEMNRKIFSGENFEESLKSFALQVQVLPAQPRSKDDTRIAKVRGRNGRPA